jgi:iron-sulfur cluster assembly protein
MEPTGAPASEAPRVTLSAEAAAYVRQKLAQMGKPGGALRVGVKGGGCNGLTYVTEFTDEPPRERELVYELFGQKLYVDVRSLKFIEGSEIVFVNTLMFQGLRFKNPLEASTCGCGETFSVKQG